MANVINLVSKFAGRCVKCSGHVPAGVMVAWDKHTRKISHIGVCPAAPVAPAPVVAATDITSPIAAFLNAAIARGLKFPKARFLAPNGGEMRLALAGLRAKNPGAVKVHLNGVWLGNVETTGTVIGPLARPENKPVLDALEAIATDPAAAAKAYGAVMCSCSFCGKALTDAGSVAVGYGPICAKHYGLPHTALGSPVLEPVVANAA